MLLVESYLDMHILSLPCCPISVTYQRLKRMQTIMCLKFDPLDPKFTCLKTIKHKMEDNLNKY